MTEEILCLKLAKNKNFLNSLKNRKREKKVICMVYDKESVEPKVWLFADSPYACKLLNGFINSKNDNMIAFDIKYYNYVIERGE